MIREWIERPMLEDKPRFKGGPREVAEPIRLIRYWRIWAIFDRTPQGTGGVGGGDPRAGINERIIAAVAAKGKG